MSFEPDLLLAVETSLDICSIALFSDSQLQESLSFRHNMHLSERLMSSIDSILNLAGVEIAQIDAFACGVGPGSFTGTRIGVMTVKMLTSLLVKPVVGVGSLEAIAAKYIGLTNALLVPMLPCRSGVVYTAVYEVYTEVPECHVEPSALSIPVLVTKLQELSPRKVILCGKSANRFAEQLKEELPAWNDINVGSVEYADAAEVGRIALSKYRSGTAQSSAIDLVPDYISPPPITMPKVPIPTENRSNLPDSQHI